MIRPRNDSADAPREALPLIEALLNGTIDDAGFARLDDLLRNDADARRLYLRSINLDTTLGDIIRNTPGLSLRLSDDPADQVSLNKGDSAAAFALAELARMHEEGVRGPIDPEAHRNTGARKAHGPSRRTVIRARLMIAGGLAAMIVLGVFVAVLVGSLTRPAPIVAGNHEPSDSPIVVATLTGQRDARWEIGRRAVRLVTGDALTAGQKLTLTRGIAELTTLRGAVATIEAPCTIELIDNANALRLESGRLVGRVETQEAEGFLVRTPHMDVTDLGTAFGIDASDAGATEVHVLEGSVKASRPEKAGGRGFSLILTKGYATRAEAGRDDLVEIEEDGSLFAGILIDPEDGKPARVKLPPQAVRAGIVGLEGQATWSNQRGRYVSVREPMIDGGLVIHAELNRVTLARDFQVPFHKTGVTNTYHPIDPATAAAGSVISSYIVCFNPFSPASCEASVTFRGEVLGVVVTSEYWRSFCDTLDAQGEPVLMYGSRLNGGSLEGLGSGNPDVLTISPDRRTLGMRLASNEYFRVIVREPPGEDRP